MTIAISDKGVFHIITEKAEIIPSICLDVIDGYATPRQAKLSIERLIKVIQDALNRIE